MPREDPAATDTFAQGYYHKTKDPVFHQTAYALLTATVLFRSMWVMEADLRPALRAKNPQHAKDVVNTMWRMIATGTFANFDRLCALFSRVMLTFFPLDKVSGSSSAGS